MGNQLYIYYILSFVRREVVQLIVIEFENYIKIYLEYSRYLYCWIIKFAHINCSMPLHIVKRIWLTIPTTSISQNDTLNKRYGN